MSKIKLNEDSLIVGNKKGQTVLYHHKDELNEIYTWSSETKAISSVSVFEHFFNDSQYVRTSEVRHLLKKISNQKKT